MLFFGNNSVFIFCLCISIVISLTHCSSSSSGGNSNSNSNGSNQFGSETVEVYEGKEGELIQRRNHPLVFNTSTVYSHFPLNPLISYGGILSLLDNESGLVSANDPNAVFLAKIALKYLDSADTTCIKKDTISLPTITLVHAQPLKHTQDGHSQHYHSFRTKTGKTITHPTQFGTTYTFFLDWTFISPLHCLTHLSCPENNSTIKHIHKFTISHNAMDKGYHLFSHTWFDLSLKDSEHLYSSLLRPLYNQRKPIPQNFHLSFDMNLHNDTSDTSSSSTNKNNFYSSQVSSKSFPLSKFYSTNLLQVTPTTRTSQSQSQSQSQSHSHSHSHSHSQNNSTSSPPPSMSVLCFNVWNVNGRDEGKYLSRFKWLGRQLQQSNADIIALQEVRFDNAYMNQKRAINQAYDISLYLPGYQFVFQPAMSYPENILGRVEEGLAIYSRYPILQSGYVLLEREGTEDFHQRICLHAEIFIPTVGSVHVFVSHFSLVEQARNKAVVRIWEFMKRFNQNQPHIFMGDLNTTPDSKAMQFLNGKTEIQGVSTKSQMKDVWLLLHPEPVQVPEDADGRVQPHDPPKDHPSYGFTFNVHSDYLTKRIDFVYLKNPTTPSSSALSSSSSSSASSSSAVITTAVPKSIDLFGNTRDPYSKQYPSDHYGLLTTFHLHQQHNNNTIYY